MKHAFPAAVLRHDLSRYFVASLLALAADVSTLSISLRLLHMTLFWSATAGFIVGAVVAYLLSIRWVFPERAFRHAPAFEFLSFVAIGLAGLGLTQLVLWLGVTELGLLAEAVKLAAAAITFVFNYMVRKALLFATARRAMAPGDHA